MIEGFVSRAALIGEPPEHRDVRWDETKEFHKPWIHPAARLEALVTVDAGIEIPTRIGARAWLMKKVHVGHDAQIGADCELAPGTVIGGHAVLEDGVRCGINVSVLPFKHIGRGARIGAGAVVTKDVPPGEVWAGVPARPLRSAASADELTDCEREGWDEWWHRSRRDPNPAVAELIRVQDEHNRLRQAVGE